MSRDKVIAYDLGTSGVKASLFTSDGLSLGDSLIPYDTIYTGKTFQEQNPKQWWEGIVSCTHQLLSKTTTRPREVAAVSISGHSLGAVPVAGDGTVLTERTPLWSDLRASEQANRFFQTVDDHDWYMTTGNGFPRELYAIFKIMWCRENQPEVFSKARCFLGSKDLCNYWLTGRMCTDPSYASGSGVYSLRDGRYRAELLHASGIGESLLPPIVGSNEVLGTLTGEAAAALGLDREVRVVCGGVDNACMALGAKGIRNGRAYMSLGSSAWIAIVSDRPVLELKHKPFVFQHVIPGLYTSATSIFAAGTSMRWARENLCPELIEQEKMGLILDSYQAMNDRMRLSPVGANKLVFNPSLAGGSMIEDSPDISGGFVGLNVGHNRNDLLRAVMEGITYNLRWALEVLQSSGTRPQQLLVVGGGSKSDLWRQMFADVMKLPIIQTNIGQNAASLGAAALAFTGVGLWKDYDRIDRIHEVQSVAQPNPERSRKYEPMYEAFREISHRMAEIGEILQKAGR